MIPGEIERIAPQMSSHSTVWPDLSGLDLQPTIETLHLWSQIAGKVRLMMTPWLNHSWHVPLYVNARGLTTGLIPHAACSIEIEFDLFADTLVIRDTNGGEWRVTLKSQSVAGVYTGVMRILNSLHIDVQIDPMPCELAGATVFHDDVVVRVYDGDVARTYLHALVQTQRVFRVFRTRFIGKCSPIHLFWGSFDLAVTRFSGRRAPPHPGGMPHVSDAVARDAYSHEVSSAGFWPGSGTIKGPCFYSYAYPAPPGFGEIPVQPPSAYFETQLGEFLLPYEAVRTSLEPDAALLEFLQSTYGAAASLAKWDRALLERQTGPIGQPPGGV
jgi:hypothetical protein